MQFTAASGSTNQELPYRDGLSFKNAVYSLETQNIDWIQGMQLQVAPIRSYPRIRRVADFDRANSTSLAFPLAS